MSKPCDTNFVILIPARKGSKGVPFKNRKLLGYTLDSIPSEYHQYIYVSTDDEEIKRTCKQRNIKVHERNPIRATDTVSIKQAVHEFIHKKRISKTVIMLYLTYPERTWDDVVKAYNFYKRHKATSLLCRKEISQHPYLMMKEKDGIFGEQIVKHNLYRRQEYPTCFEICHYVSIFEPWKFRELNSNMYNEKTIFFPIKSPIDVDENKDLEKFIENKDTPEMNNVKPTISPTKKSNVLYKDFIKNKNVIIVGPSRNLLGTNLGKTIDEYDVVIRTNGAFPVQDGYKKDYGARCDVLYTNGYFSKNEIHKKIVEYERNGLNYIIHKISNKQIHQKNTNIQLNAWRAYNPKELTGIHIIKEMIQYGAKSITYAGMDFYMDKNNRYLDNYLPKGFKYDEEREHRIHDIKGSRLFIKELEEKGTIKKLIIPKNGCIKNSEHPIKNMVFAITTFNRKESLVKTINSWDATRNKNFKWTLVIADDNSNDGTKKFLNNLAIPGVNIKILYNKNNTGVHQQTNNIFNYIKDITFDYAFKSDDDIIFKKKGWDSLYYDASCKTGYYHLIFCDKQWSKNRNHLRRSIFSENKLLENCTINTQIQGALFTFNKKVLNDVGEFDTESFGKDGVGHIDFSLRCCRLGYNDLNNPYDVVNSNDYIYLNNVPSTRSRLHYNKYKYQLALTERTFVSKQLFCIVDRKKKFNPFIHAKIMIEKLYSSYENCIVVLGYNVGIQINDLKKLYPNKKIIIYQLEQLFNNGSMWFNVNEKNNIKIINNTKFIQKQLNSADEIWDYDLDNIEFLNKIGYKHVKHVPLQYCESIKKENKIKVPKYDIVFYGSINQKRKEILAKICNRYKTLIITPNHDMVKDLHATVYDTCWGDELFKHIFNSKIVLNLHYYDTNIQEQVRIFELLINNCNIVSERSRRNYFGDLITEFDNERDMFNAIDNQLKNNTNIRRDVHFKHLYKKIDVLIGCLRFANLTGSEISSLELGIGLSKLNCNVHITSTVIGDEFKNICDKHNIKTYNINELPNKQFDMICANHAPITQKLLDTYNNSVFVNIVRSEIIDIEKPIIHNKINKYVAIRPSIKTYLMDKFKIEEKNINVIYNPFDTDKFKPSKKILRNKKPIVLFAGAFENLRKKSVYDLVLSTIDTKNVWLVGQDIQGYASELSNKYSHVNYYCATNNIENFYNKCDETAGIMLGRTTIEGFLCNKPGIVYIVDADGNIINKEYHEVPKNCDIFSRKFHATQILNLYYENIPNI